MTDTRATQRIVTRPGAGNTPRPAGRRAHRFDVVAAWGMLTPAVVMFLTFVIVPALVGIGLSFTEWDFFRPPVFVGFDNYTRLVSDPDVWQALGVTIQYVVLGVIPTVLIGFMMAVLINANMPGVPVLRVLYFVPVVLSVAVSAVLWSFMYDPRQGPIAALFRVVDVPPVDFLNSEVLALPSLVLMMIWLALPIVIIFYLAGLQRVPEDIYSAAALDGAGTWRMLWSMTWPNVMPTTLVVVVLQIINFVANSLDVALIMTGGGPLGATRSLSLYAYEQAFMSQNVGYASALSIFQLLLIVGIIALGRVLGSRSFR
ncbi:carbohydrate ABC transporter permease [Agromyces marinus]|uniref:ABC transporter permease n=1 Tax=Agromyces marinus TaxID=1389020 RepID=A0ABN6Y8G0_9MICO|nr:sugar ABC transporter permease [Agromyces marinus]UIP58383.1 Melibiose/raffinose/stachyose import permease protein MelD [Agromyces marinus]BDZ53364.1 ABC transporter permease [Agromyces marinus]